MKKIQFVCCLAVCAALLLTACRKGAVNGNNISNDNFLPGGRTVSDITQEPEWVYVPEVITVEDERADYGGMQLIGGHICYISMNGEAQDELQRICKYSITGKELADVPIDWPMEEKNRDVVAYVFDQDYSVWLIANVYSADYSQLSRFLCRFDAEGKSLVSQEITEQLGRGSDISVLRMDEQGRLYVFAGDAGIWLYNSDGSFHGSIPYNLPENVPSQKEDWLRGRVQIRGTFMEDDERFCVCMKKDASEHCTLYEVDFEKKRLTEIMEEFPDISGLCGGMRPEETAEASGELDVSSGELDVSTGELDASTGELDASTEQADASNGELDASTGQADASNGELDASTGQLDASTGPGSSPARVSVSRDRQYDLLLYDDTGVYGYDFPARKSSSGQAMEELFIWSDSDINGYYVVNAGVLGDGRYVCVVEDWTHEDVCMILLTRTRAEDVPRREELVLAAVGDGSELAALAVSFNRISDQYRLTVKNYDSLTELYNAILAKETMDIIDLSGVDAEKLFRQSVLENLTPWLEQSDVLAPSDFVDGILDVYTFDGVLTGIPAAFRIRTVVGNSARLQNKAGLTLEELLAAVDRRPEELTFDGVTKEEMMQYLMMFNEDTFIDRETGACHFDSESFRAVLAYVNRFPDSPESGKEEVSLPTRIQNGEVLYAIAEMNILNSFQEFAWMFGEDAACVGFPTADGRGGHLLFASDAYGIAAVSEHKEGAWRFIEAFLAQENSSYYSFYYVSRNTSFSTLKRILDEKVENSIEAGRQISDGHMPRRIYDDGAVFRWHVLTWDEVNVILNLVPESRPWFDMEDNEIIKIINEEAQAYYSGQKGIEDVAGVIQNRVQLYVEENM